MKIKKIEWKNFGSYGNNQQIISFEENQGNFYLVLGTNGAGKSTMSDVIKFGLYGKVDSKKIKDLPNRFNNNLYVKIEVEKNPTTVAVVERGISPNFFRVSINGVDYDQAGKKNIQEFLEEEILGMPYYVFNNMVSLSINDFKSFINMGVNDKRMIIDRLFGLEILGSVRWKVRYQVKSMKEEIEVLDRELLILESSISSSEKELESLSKKIKNIGEEKKRNLEEKIEKIKVFLNEVLERLKKIEEKSKNVESEIKNHESKLAEQKIFEHSSDTKISLYKKGKCPTCEGDLTSDHHKAILEESIRKNEEAKKAITDINNFILSLREKKNKVNLLKNDLATKKGSATTQMSFCEEELKKISFQENTDDQTFSLQNIMQESITKKRDTVKKKDLEEKKISFYRLVEDVFGEKGVKISALKRIIPVLNIEILKVLQELGMNYRVAFNEEFDVSIQHLGFKVSAEQLSTGEKKKVDFAVLIALIRIMKTKFAGLNLIYLDEIFSSIDSDGIHHILKVLHETCRCLNLNIFVINHSQLPTEIFDYRVEISKNSGFSNLTIEKIG